MNNLMGVYDELLNNNGMMIPIACYVLAEIVKATFPSQKRFIPLITGILGLTLGFLGVNFFSDRDFLSRGILGAFLGWSSTGLFEMVKGMRNEYKKSPL